MNVAVECIDGNTHDVQIYSDISVGKLYINCAKSSLLTVNYRMCFRQL